MVVVMAVMGLFPPLCVPFALILILFVQEHLWPHFTCVLSTFSFLFLSFYNIVPLFFVISASLYLPLTLTLFSLSLLPLSSSSNHHHHHHHHHRRQANAYPLYAYGTPTGLNQSAFEAMFGGTPESFGAAVNLTMAKAAQ